MNTQRSDPNRRPPMTIEEKRNWYNPYYKKFLELKAKHMQPEPKPNNHPHVVDEVVKDMQARKQLGIKRYGTALQPFNGRDALQDAYDEALDMCVYLKQVIIELNHEQK